MVKLNPKFITDQYGKRLSVVLSIKDFNKLIDLLEDLHDVKSYDEVLQFGEKPVAIDEAFRKIEEQRKFS